MQAVHINRSFASWMHFAAMIQCLKAYFFIKEFSPRRKTSNQIDIWPTAAHACLLVHANNYNFPICSWPIVLKERKKDSVLKKIYPFNHYIYIWLWYCYVVVLRQCVIVTHVCPFNPNEEAWESQGLLACWSTLSHEMFSLFRL